MVSRVILWTPQRCVSGAFERSIRTRNNCQVFHEPFCTPFYFGPERQSMRFASLPIDPKGTYEAVVDKLLADYPSKEFYIIERNGTPR